MQQDDEQNLKIVAGIACAMVVALVVIFFTKANRPPSVPVPTQWKAYNASDGSFACKLPENWRRTGSGAYGLLTGVTAEKASAGITITSDLQGSLMGDMAQASNQQMQSLSDSVSSMTGTNMPAAARTRPPVEQVHLAEKPGATDGAEYENVQEGPMHPFPSPLGEARVSDWTAESSGAFGSVVKVHGYRATILGREKRFSVECHCSEADWPKLKSSFQNVIASVGPGKERS